jgi:regulatory protein
MRPGEQGLAGRVSAQDSQKSGRGRISGTDQGNAGNPIRSAALKLLALRSRSERQLRERLLAKFPADSVAIEQCITDLKESRYIDDAQLARNYAASRLKAKAIGRNRLSRELEARGISRDVIDQALGSEVDETTEESLIDQAIQKRIRINGRPTNKASAKRMFDHLARLGFQYDLIRRKLKALKANVGDE